MEYSVIDYIISTDDEIRQKIEANADYQAILRRQSRIYEKLINMLNEEQKELFDKFEETETEELHKAVETYFKAGMKLGIRIVAESMYD